MIRRAFAALGMLVLLCGAAPPEPPEALGSYIANGEFEPGDYRWMSGAFPDATKAQKQEYEAITAWVDECAATAKSETVAKLRELGVENPRLDKVPLFFPLCDQVAIRPQVDVYDNFADFTHHLAATKPIFDTLLATTELAERIAGPATNSLADQLRHRTLAEQIYRYAFSWVWLPEPVKGVPALTAKQKPIFLALLSAEVGARDRANTAWLNDIVAKQGWPTISLIGADGARNAWLLAQHADQDPVFQFRVLRLMEPSLAQGEVSRRNYAYLYDRVMLKLTGVQRYATQLMCKDGERVPQPLEDEARMPEFRRSAGLEPFEEYLAMISEPCPDA